MSQGSDLAMVDEQWRGYDLRAAAPLFALALLLTVGLLLARLLFSDLTDALITYFLVLILWPALLFISFYRAVTYTYRITNRALVVDRGFLDRPVLPMAYGEMTDIEYGSSGFYSLLNVGWVLVGMSDGRTVKLRSLRDPGSFAAVLRERSTAAKGKTVES
jgi:hypothetical protein